ncbi:MAG TPA: phenylalanine--tRNA ligase subunit beta [Solirubrobacteraceae bacterium]|jgi:phenylalanyl-tRNA synthetase beta chain|nr:phenylalanine--tRNA ligase subunit beta [Solirubrobacteraceae bacterium]
MKTPLNWLREYCDPDLDTNQIEERLTMTGTKVETILRHGAPSVENFVVAKVLSVEAHPNADRLRVCSVDVGAGEPATIVCGAPNVAAGQTVAVALPGAVMPGGMRIKGAKLRGVASSGMILAADELQIDSDHAGIMVLDELILACTREGDAELAPGAPLADVLSVGTDVLELEITPNRPDCLGVYGVARELHAATGAPLAPEPWTEDPGSAGELSAATVTVQCPDLCPRFTARAFEDVTIAPSPLWLKARLSAAGQRPINNVVDITNYVMLLTGQPLHAFDLDRVAGGKLTVRRAREGEQVTTLDGQVRTLDSEMVVIDDALGPTSIAGIMGGERSEVHDGTTRVLMEVANWSGPNIHRSSWALGLRSEASGRFEKGLAPEQCLHAQAIATKLMIELCGARLLPGTIDIGGPAKPPMTIRLRERRVESILGMAVPRERQREILVALDFAAVDAVADVPGGTPGAAPAGEPALDVTVPPLRREDITREADLIEEIARINGLGELPATLPARRGAYGRLSDTQRLRRRAVDALVGRGLYEAVGWTFTAPGLYDRLHLPADDPRRRAPVLENPLSEDQSLLRTTLLGSLLDVARHNVARGMADLRLFEVGRVFALDGDRAVSERDSVAMMLTGRIAPVTWGAGEPAKADLFAAKGVLEALGEALRVEFECRPGEQPFLHPGRSAGVLCDGEQIGWLGELHPLVAREWDLDGAAVMELDLDRLLALAAAGEHGYQDVISYPGLRQDLAVVLSRDVPAARATELVRAAGGDLLDSVEVFDVYEGPALPPPSSEQVGEGRRSLALSLSFRASDRTLTDADVVPLRERIVQALEELGGELRG